MAIRRATSKSGAIREYLKTNSNRTTAEIATAVGWTTQRVSTALWAEMQRKNPQIVRKELAPTRGRTTPTLLYSHIENCVPVGLLPPETETTKPEPPDLPEYVQIKDRVIFVEELAQPPEPVGTLTDFADALAQAIAQHVVSRVKGHLETQLRNILPPSVANPAPISIEQLTSRVLKVEDTKPKKPTVLIAGLLPSQAGIIDTEFRDVFDLRFYMVDDSLKHLAAMAKHVDHVFTFTSKVSHAVEEVMIGKGHKVHRCSGGMTMLKDSLLKLYMGELV